MEKKMKSIIAILVLSASLQGCMLMMPAMHGRMNHDAASEAAKPASDSHASDAKDKPSVETSKPAETTPHQH